MSRDIGTINKKMNANGISTVDVEEFKTILRQSKNVKDNANGEIHVNFILNTSIVSYQN